MTWNFVGEHTFTPDGAEVNIGEFNLSEGQDTIWARVTQLNEPGDWPFSFGILSWRSSEGNELGSIKIYPTQFGEVFRLTCGRAPLVGAGSIWFEPRGYNLQWIKAGYPWTLKFEAQAGRSALENQIWERANETIFPVNEGDALQVYDVDALKVKVASNGTAEGTWIGQGTGGVSKPGYFETRVDATGEEDIATFSGQSGVTTIRADGSASFASGGATFAASGSLAIEDSGALVTRGIYVRERGEEITTSGLISRAPEASSTTAMYVGNARIATSAFYTVWLDPDNPDNYNEGNHYIGPTLNIAEAYLAAMRRIEELEAKFRELAAAKLPDDPDSADIDLS